MKVAILGESRNDAAALLEIAAGILGFRPQYEERHLFASGWPSVRSVLSPTIKQLHYRREVDGLLIFVDSDHTSLKPGDPKNRREALMDIADQTLKGVAPVHGRPKLRVAVAVAMPAIEAWLLSPSRSGISEEIWENGLIAKSYPYSKAQLKEWAFGIERPETGVRRERLMQAALVCSQSISKLKTSFPNGFGKFHDDLISWRSF